MLPILSFLIILLLSLLVSRIATVALVHTGMGLESARFQARSALTGVGFTTGEAEQVVGHPVRRRIVMTLMLVGNAGIVTAISSLLLGFIGMQASGGSRPLLILSGGIGLLWWLSASQWVDARMRKIITWALNRWTTIDARDYARLLHLTEDYGVTELKVEPGDWLAGRVLRTSQLSREGVLVLGVECPGGNFIGAPTADTEIRAGDRLLLYGRLSRIAEVDRRSAGRDGERAHAAAMHEHADISLLEHAAAGR